MRAILLIALFAFAAQAAIQGTEVSSNTFDFRAHYFGFADELDLNEAQKADANVCFDALVQAQKSGLDTIMALKHAQGAQVGLDALQDLEVFKTQVQPACQKYLSDLIEGVVLKHNPDYAGSDLRRVVVENFKASFQFVIQELFVLIDAIIDGRHSTAGHVEAKIFKILTGVERPEAHKIDFTTLKFSGRLLNNTAEFIEHWTGFLKARHMYNETTLDSLVHCSESTILVSNSIQQLSDGHSKSGLKKFEQVLELLRANIALVENCKAAWELSWGPFIAGLRSHPLPLLWTLLHNTGINLPQIVQLGQELLVAKFEGNFTALGEKEGLIYNTVYGGTNL